MAADLACHWRDVFLERAPQVFVDPRASSKAAEEHRIAELERMVGRLTMEPYRVKKSLETAALPYEQRREIVRTLAAAYPVQTLCDILELAPSTYYYQPQGHEELNLREAVETVAVEYPRYGSRRITAELRRRGWEINRKHIQRVMREENLLVQVRRYCRTTMSRHPYGRYSNLVKQLEIVRPDQVWCADLTYIHLPRQFCYLAVLMDIFTRSIRGS